MTTLRDVARRANVSVTAASYALNNTGTISEATRQRVRDAAKELHYQPNAFARRLRTAKIGTIGVFITRFGGSFYEEILEGIHDTILKTNYELIISPESFPERRILFQRQVDGAIVFDSKIESEKLMRLVAREFPIIVLDRYLEHEFLLPLLLDNQHGTRQAFHHLYRQGMRKIAYISGARDSLDNQERTQAFLAEAAQYQLCIDQYRGNFTERSGFLIGKDIIGSGELPEGVFCANDQMAIGFLNAMQAAHLHAPDDIAVVGFDDIQIARYLRPSLTTVGASRQSWGSQAAQQLIDFLDANQPFQHVRMPTQLIVRESSRRTQAGAVEQTRQVGESS